MILDFIKGILAGLTQHPGVQWGNTVMETPYEGWRMWIQDMFAALVNIFRTVFIFSRQ